MTGRERTRAPGVAAFGAAALLLASLAHATDPPGRSGPAASLEGHTTVSLNGVSLNGLTLNGLTLNGLTLNGLTLNGLTLNGLTLNGLTLNGLTLNGLTLNGLPLPIDTAAAARADLEIFGHMVKCALPAGETVIVRTGGVERALPGSLGLAPEWKDGGLSIRGQRWVTACLMAHVNAFGEHVRISLRGDHQAMRPTVREKTDYRAEEGAFFGNLFGEEPWLATCIGEEGSQAESSADLASRVCATDVADGTTACGFVSVGRCSEVCQPQGGSALGYTECRSANGKADSVSEVITVYLKGQ